MICTASVFDVAAYILEVRGPMSMGKLQKLIYYCQAGSLVWDGRPMFDEPIEAWESGPVVRSLYEAHRGVFQVTSEMVGGDSSRLDQDAKSTIDAVVSLYGDKNVQWLNDLIRLEEPYKEARRESVGYVGETFRWGKPISTRAMKDYYSVAWT